MKTSFISRAISSILTVTMLTVSGFAAESSADQPAAVVKQGPSKDEVGLFFLKGDTPELVVRSQSNLLSLAGRSSESTSHALALAIVSALIAGPDDAEKAAGIEPFLPEGTKLEKVEFESTSTIKIYINFPSDFIAGGLTDNFIENRMRHFIESLDGLDLQQFLFYTRDPGTGEYVSLRDLLPKPPEIKFTPQQEPESPLPGNTDSSPADTKSLTSQNGFFAGALTGKHVVLNASHGWYDNIDTTNRWTVQRANTWQILEDFSSAMFVNQYVIPMMQNAGAIVRPVREPDTQTNTVVIDNAMGAPGYVESGAGWIFSAIAGYTHKDTYVGKTDNPFGSGSTSRLIAGTTVGAPTHSASFTPVIPADGYYNVYIAYTAGTDRTANAHWQVKHSGGITDFRINQKRTGSTWFLLGNFYFTKDAPASQAQVVAYNDSGDASYLSVDAVKFGGGMGNMARNVHGLSGKPRWQEDATNYLHYIGMLNSGFFRNSNSDPQYNDDEAYGWYNRPSFARWEVARDGLAGNLSYIGWHTNASTWNCTGGVENQGTGRGTLVIRDLDSNASAATKDFTLKIRDGMFNSVRASYNSTWPMRSPGTNGLLISDNYGEALQSRLGSTVPGFIFEGLFHDNIADSSAYKDGKFRYAAARGIVNGLIQYYGGTVFPPEPVQNFRVTNIGNNQVRLEWARGPVGNTTNHIGSTATNFRIFKSSNGYGFDNGVDVGNFLSHTMTLTPGELVFVRVAATNAAGISIPSETLATRVATADNLNALIVNGFDRDDEFLAPIRSQASIGGCTAPNTYREMDPRKYQSRNYSIQHAKAIVAKGGYGIDSASRNAINLGQVGLGTYPMVFWIGGQQAEADTDDNINDEAFKPAEQTAITNYLQNGGRLFLSGSEIAWDFGRVASAKRDFLNNILKTGYAADDSNSYIANGTGGIFAGLGSVGFDNGSGNTYDVPLPDVLSAVGGSTINMFYSTGGAAGLQYQGTINNGSATAKIVYLGFPFETVTSEALRNNIMSRTIDYFIPAGVNDWNSF